MILSKVRPRLLPKKKGIRFVACRSRTTPRPQNASKSRWLGCNIISRNQCFATTTNTVSAQQRQRQQQTKKTSYNRKGGKSIYVAATQRILESPVGSLDSRTWHEAEWTIKFWNKQATPESVKYAFALLDRFLQEYYHNIERKDSSGSKNDDFLSEKNNTAFPVILSSANLNFSVNNWRLCAKKLNTTSRRTSSIPNPTEMLQTIDSFRTKHHRDQNLMPLSPNVFTYSMILDALAFGQPDLGENSYPLASAKAIDKNKIKADDNGNVGWDFSITPAPIIAERILERLMEEGKEDILVRPTIVTFNSAMKVWARSRMQEAPDRAEALLMKIKELSKQEEWTDLEPNNSTYAAVINTFAGSGREDAIKKVEVMLQEIKMSPFSDVYPNGDIYLGVLKAFGRSQDPSAGQRASGLLQEVVTRYQILRKQGNGADGNEDEFASIIREIQATYKCFLAVMNIFVNQREPQRAEDVLDDLQSLYEASGHERHLCPDSAAFNTVLRAWGKSRSKDAVKKAEAILERMRSTANIAPDINTYNQVLHILSRSGGGNAVELAEKILKTIEESPGISANAMTYNTILHLWARSNRKDSVDRSEGIIRQWWQQYNDRMIGFMPDNVSYNSVIDAMCRSQNRNAAERAEGIFREMQQQYKRTKNRKLQPTRVSYGSLITAFAKNARFKWQFAEKAQDLFDEMQANGIEPSVAEYNSTIHAWAVVGNVDRAEMMIERMLDDYSKGCSAAKPDAKSFSSVINGLAKMRSNDPWGAAKRAESICMRMEQLSGILGDEVRPNVYSFNSVLDCYARCKKNEAAAEHAERILEHMQDIYKRTGNQNIKPNVVSWTTTMLCWVNSQSKKSPDRVESLFQDLRKRYEETGDRDLKPTQYTYNCLIGAYARDTDSETSVDKAVAHFDDMIDRYNYTRDSELRPGPMHFSVILSAFSRRGMAQQAESFLERVLDIGSKYDIPEGEKLDISSSFNGVIGAHARSQEPGSAEKAEATLRRMINLENDRNSPVGATPNVISYTSCLLAWSLASSEEERNIAVQRSEKLLKEMVNNNLQPNRLTYGTFLEVIAKSDLSDKEWRAKQVLQMMDDNGVRPDSFALKIVQSLA